MPTKIETLMNQQKTNRTKIATRINQQTTKANKWGQKFAESIFDFVIGCILMNETLILEVLFATTPIKFS